MSLGPVTGNRDSGAHKRQPKPGLQQRLNEQVQRRTPEGTFKTGPDGRMEFVPKLTENQQTLQRMRAIKSTPTPEMDAKRATEEAREPSELVVGNRTLRIGSKVHVGVGVDTLVNQPMFPFCAELAQRVARQYGTVVGFSENRKAAIVAINDETCILLTQNLCLTATNDEAAGLAASEAGVLTPSEASGLFTAPLAKGDKVQTLTGLIGVVVSVAGEWISVHHAAWSWPATIQRRNLTLIKKLGA
jgi:hypothetical protein